MKVAQRFGTWALFASIALLAALGIVVPRTATALPPETLGVQGRFVTATGQPIPDGQYAVTVSFYKLANDALPLFSETQPNVKVSGGLFTLQAGATQSLAPAGFKAGDATWVGIQVSNEVELPRVALKFVPYALRAQTAGDLACSGCVKAGHLDAAALQPYAKTNTLATSAMLPALDGVPCGSGLVVKGLNVNGTLNCVAAGTYTAGAGLTLTNGQFALAPPSGAVLGGIKATTCGAGKVVTGVAGDGSLTCAASFTGNLLGDVTGPSTGTVVTALQNVPVAAGAPFDQAVLKYDSIAGKWAAAVDEVGGGGGGGLAGSGTAGNLARWTDGATLGVSLLFDDGSHVGIGTASPTESLHVVGNTKITGNAVVAGSVEFGNAGAVLKADQGGSAELGSSTVAGAKPYLDLHYGTGASQDYNVRLANDADRTLTITGTGGDAKLQVAGELAATRMCIGADCRNSWNAADGNSVSPLPRTCPTGQVPVSTGPYKWGCQVNCAYGSRDCNNQPNDGCETNVNTSSTNCSECGIACSPNHITPLCTSGSCQSGVCHAGYDDCNLNKQTDGCEISLTANTANCGQCGQTCSSNGMASITCGPTPLGSPQPGYCNGACLLGRADCNVNKLGDGCEIVTTVDVDNCGGCGKICSNTNVVSRTCGSSVCTSPCNLGFSDCNSDKLADGCEINTTNNLSHCSACGLACSSNHISPTCVGSSCQMGVCEADYADCNGNKQADGCEVHLPTNMANCGTCGDACSGAGMSVKQCAAGDCTGTCALSSSEAFANCNGNLRTDGCEINLTANPDHCGSCGVVCSNSNMETRTCGSNLGDAAVTGFNAVFSTCSYSGRTGPDQGSCDSTYSGNPALAGKVTLQGGIQRYIVATTGTYDIDAYGAQGGLGNNQPGGYGARSKGRFNLQKGDVLWFLVGQQSPNATYEGGGGGGSFVVKGANYASATPLVIAGGGGGGRYSHGQGQPGQAGPSGSTTYWAGGSGGNGGSSSAGGYGGGGFTGNGATWGGNGSGGQAFVNGGVGGARGYTSSQYASDGGFGGGGGGYQSGSSSTTGSSGAGGGGGYSGGGAGYSSPGYGGGGGSYNAGTDQILTTGAKSGNGQINLVGALGEPGKCNGACKVNFADCNADKLTDGCETPTNSTVAHCGGCGQACSANHIASPTCAGSQCNGSCDNGYADCNGNKLSDGCEMDIVAGSITHCGACNDGCSTNHMSSTQCAGSNCTGTCSAEYFNCDSDMRSNGCEKFCSSSHVVNNSCGGGTCTGTCEAGWANCDGDLAGNGCETHIDVDINNCGSCGSICNATGLETNTCTGGTCSGTCLINSSQANGNCNNALKPDGCEINLTTNADNCGSCGVVCSNDHMATRICTGNLADPTVTGFTATFTPCGYNSGRTGPDQGSCNSAYSGQPALAGKVTVQSGIQRYVVATTGTYDIDAYGAQGGMGNNQPGGYGARSKGRFKLQKDDILWLLVGQQGLNATYEAGGAGGSFVVKGANPATGTPLVIAGGGGGGRYSQGQGQPGQAGTSGSTTYWAGGSGGAGGSSSAGGYGGGGLTGNGATWGGNGSGGQAFVNGGLGGVRGYTSSQYSSDGGFGGGGGSYQSGTSSTTGSSGAGGGGGYSGGGAGYSSPGYGGGGGSYNAGTNQILTTGAKSGTGQVVLTGVLGEPGACSGACESNYADCNANKQTDGCEVPTLTDVAHCGGCGKACSNNHVSSPTCGSGTCTGNCDSGFDDCNGNKLSDGCEINIQSGNITHCGTCGDGCSTNNKAATDCSGGNCTGACNADYFNCDSNLRSNGCEKYCSPNGVVNNSCSASTCTGTCDAGRANCNADIASDGCEITLAGDILNCGSCGKICSPTGLASNSCTSGACTGVCKLSTTEATFDCNSNIQADGCEIDLTTNADNCGSCGVACSNNHMQSRTCGNNLQDTAFLNYAMNFSTCGAGGRFGPSQGSCDAAYGANVVQVTTGIQRWLVPKDGWYFVEAQGAQGGYANGQQGGYGARMKGRFKFSKNDVLWILVGQQSPNATYVGGGGGGSFVVKGAAYASGTPLVVAGGGGGAKYNYGGGNGQGGTTAINGGQTYFAGGTNGSGGGSSGSDYGGYGGGGYTGNGGNNAYNASGGGKAFVNGGAGGAYGYNSAQYSSEGGFGGGGGGFQRDSSSSTSGSSEHSGAGGGGGYSGGGAGWANGGPGYGAGGGSYNIGELQSNTSAAKSGDGKVTISGALAVPGACNGTCEAGFGDCNADKLTDGCETSTSANAANCGACGNVCSANHIASPTCSGSACTGACNSGYADCNNNKLTDGCEVNFTSGDIANCGACGDACSTNHMTSTTCGGSNCAGTCSADYFNCDGNLRSNGCEKLCSSNGVVSNGCSTGFCSGVCALGRANCDGDIASNGCEIDSANDKNNCGGCGIVCSGLNYCDSGTCKAPKRVFLSNNSVQAYFGGVGPADSNCQSWANSAGLGGAWKAWLSANNSGNQVASRFSQASVRYVKLDGTMIANNWADLTNGDIASPIDRSEYNTYLGGNEVFTGTQYNGGYVGSSNNNCSSWTNGTSSTSSSYQWYYGRSDDTGSGWSYSSAHYGGQGSSYRCSTAARRLYCFEQ